VITNERQYRITKSEAKKFAEAISSARESGPGPDVDPRVHQAMIESLESELALLRNQLNQYEMLKAGKVRGRKIRSLRELPAVLIEGRIAARLTQRELAKRLEFAEQQIQRYEATSYAGVNFERLQDVADRLGLELEANVIYSDAVAGASRLRAVATRDGDTADGDTAVKLELLGEQRTLYEALASRDQQIAEMYLGGVTALNLKGNPERFPQAAHSFREAMDRLPPALGLRVEALTARLADQVQRVEAAWSEAVEHSRCFKDGRWEGDVDRPLARLIAKVGELVEWRQENRPRRRAEAADAIRLLSVSEERLLAPLEDLAVRQWMEARDYFIAVAHHRAVNEEEFTRRVAAFEGFVLARLRPQTFADFDTIDSLVEEAEDAAAA
jgi:transcriptional regulator with XRE-family HTH domain